MTINVAANAVSHIAIRQSPTAQTQRDAATWLIAALSPDERYAWGVCDLGLGFVETGGVDMVELRGLRGRLGLPVERDRWFTPSMTIGDYQSEGARLGRLTV